MTAFFKGHKEMKQIEILAPAGSYASLKAALASGADAVYVGGDKFGARAYAENFTREQLLHAIDEVHLHGKKIYMTMNTLLKEKELMESFVPYFEPYYEQGIDAVIVQDMGVLTMLKKHFPDVAIHASTQMTITNELGARFAKQEGIQRVVPARELHIDEVRKIAETGIEVECFVHGALCYCYSGQCLYSSLVGARSGNRGQCAQPCRLPYQVDGKKASYVLSLKDICTLQGIPDLIEAGVCSFKIEGRMKKPEYVAAVTSIYRKYTDWYLQNGRDGFGVEQKDMELLMDIYNRGGFHSGYYGQQNGRDMVSLERPNHAGVPALKVIQPQKKQMQVKALTKLHKGDVIEIPWKSESEPENYTLGQDYPKGQVFFIPVRKMKGLEKDTILSRTRNEMLLKEMKALAEKEIKEKIKGKLMLSLTKSAKLILSGNGIVVESNGAQAEPAKNQPMDAARISKQMRKTGGTPYEFESLEVEIEDTVFMPMQALNELRRQGIQSLEEAVLEKYRRHRLPFKECSDSKIAWNEKNEKNEKKDSCVGVPGLFVSVEQWEQFLCAKENPYVNRIYTDSTLVQRKTPEEWKQILSLGTKERTQIYLSMPYIFRERAHKIFEKMWQAGIVELFDGVLIRNLESYQFLQEKGYEKPIILDANVYMFNTQSKEFWRHKKVHGMTAPMELNEKDLNLLGVRDMEMVVYGYIPMMVSAQCVQKTIYGCNGQEAIHYLKDRYKKEFTVKNYCDYCYNIIYNSVPLMLEGEIASIRKLSPAAIRLSFTRETDLEMEVLLRQYGEQIIEDKKLEPLKMEHTKGHFKRGVK